MKEPVVVVLASGRGERFVAAGGHGSKLQALLAGKPVIDHTLAAVRGCGLPFHVEDAGHAGMGDSIAAAVRATQDAGGWLILPADLPLVHAATIRTVAAALQEHVVAVPTYEGQRGHPVGFAAECREALLALSGDRGASAVVQAQAALGRLGLLALDDPGVVTDVDTPEDLDRAQRMLARALNRS